MTACSSASLLRVVNLKIHNESGPFGLAGRGDEGQKIEILVVAKFIWDLYLMVGLNPLLK